MKLVVTVAVLVLVAETEADIVLLKETGAVADTLEVNVTDGVEDAMPVTEGDADVVPV